MKILMAASEVVPFAKTGGLADVAGALPLALLHEGQEVIIVMPRYKTITPEKFALKRLNKDISYSVLGGKIKVYFIEHEEYFNRDNLYSEKTGDYKDNLDRFSYYCRRTLKLLKEINFQADIVHCHDWQAALIPVYLKTLLSNDSFYKKMRSVLTIHNIGYQGLFPKEEFEKLKLDWGFFSVDYFEFFDQINILKGGLVCADMINTVSPTYSREIQTPQFGFGLEGVLNRRRDSVFGILNGIDRTIWDPEHDAFIASSFSVSDLEGKAENKAALLKLCKLPVKKNTPLIGMVSRLAEAKGFDIIVQGVEQLLKKDLQLVILGTGDQKYHQSMSQMCKKYPQSISLNLTFDDVLAHKIYAGADMFLMPSQYEPCGLGQLIALRYGTIPIVFKTGGLADTVNEKNGFIFDEYSSEALLKQIKKAMMLYQKPSEWKELVGRALACDFSWEESGKKYLELYEKALSR